MNKMILGNYTFGKNPNGMTFIQKDREVASQKTYTGVSLFSWGLTYIGKVLELSWPSMSTAQYASLQTLYEADAPVVFNPQDGSSKTFNVEILSLDSAYHIYLDNSSGHLRINVKIQLLIMSEVA